MSWKLHGPFAFDANAVTAGARTALSETNAAISAGAVKDAPGTEPGIYILVQDEGSLSIAGFWLVFGPNYLDDGPQGPPEKVVPFAGAVLDAAVEEVWWKTLPVANRTGNTWDVPVILEWSATLAGRAALPPPGQPVLTDAEEDRDGEAGGWMDAPDRDMPPPPVVGSGWADDDEEEDEDDWGEIGPKKGGPTAPAPKGSMSATFQRGGTSSAIPRGTSAPIPRGTSAPKPAPKPAPREAPKTPWSNLPAQRTLLAVVRGKLTKEPDSHTGHFELVAFNPWRPGDLTGVISMPQWMGEIGNTNEVPEKHGWGRPLQLPGNRIGFPITGWLTRDLVPWPASPREATPGTLTERDISNPVVQKAVFATSVTIGNMVAIFGAAIFVAWTTAPRIADAPTAAPPDPQPALSLCSEEHAAFVNEFRCQIRRLSDPNSTEICGDQGQPAGPSTDDLQAAWCGLADQRLDAVQSNLPGVLEAYRGNEDELPKYYLAELAAAQACFNVLDQPDPYAQPWDPSKPNRVAAADPDRFLRDEALAIAPLQNMVTELTQVCKTYQSRTEMVVEGAALSTHLGASYGEDEAGDQPTSALRRKLVNAATSTMNPEFRTCFTRGVQQGTGGPTYSGLCRENDGLDRAYGEMKAWNVLAGEPTGDVVNRYFAARFNGNVGNSAPAVWRCHDELTLEDGRLGWAPVSWQLKAPLLFGQGYSSQGAVRSQLLWDAIVTSSEAKEEVGTCWSMLVERTNSYNPVHPLVKELDPKLWTNEEQQLCAQMCATHFRVAQSERGVDWVTHEMDLNACINPDAPNPAKPPQATAGFDPLVLPWSDYRKEALDAYNDRAAKTDRTPAVARVDECSAWPTKVVKAASIEDQLPRSVLTWTDLAGAPTDVWICPKVEDVCAFNLIAQDWMPAGEDGFLTGSRSPKDWAGETQASSRIAGGFPASKYKAINPNAGSGLAATAADNLNKYGGTRSTATCGHVAIQCFTSLMLEVTGDPAKERYEWKAAWWDKVLAMKQEKPQEVFASYGPWCASIQNFIYPDGTLPEGEFDYPCVLGVQDALTTVQATLTVYEQDYLAEKK